MDYAGDDVCHRESRTGRRQTDVHTGRQTEGVREWEREREKGGGGGGLYIYRESGDREG